MKHLPLTLITAIPHKQQKYDTAGDYYEAMGDAWKVTVSKLPDWRMEAAIVIHELVEMYLTKHRKINWDVITGFDKSVDSDDPGCLPQAPYHKEHMCATEIEKIFCKEIGLDWEEYNKALDALEYTSGMASKTGNK